jgi:chromosome segregation ATPase
VAKEEQSSLQTQISSLEREKEDHTKEIATLRSRTNLSQQNWAKERDDMVQREAQLREELDAAKQAMQDWEVLAVEERSLRENLNDRVAELEEQLSNQEDSYARAVSERDDQSVTVDGLQRALAEVHEGNGVRIVVLCFC